MLVGSASVLKERGKGLSNSVILSSISIKNVMFLPLGGKVRMRGKSEQAQQFPLTPPLSLKGRGRRIFNPSPQSPHQGEKDKY